jgi:DNA-binding protein H-NS
MAAPGAASGETTSNGGNLQRPVRNRRATEKGKTMAADSDTESLEVPATPKKAKTRGQPAKNSEHSIELLHKLIEMMEELKEEMRQQKEEMQQQREEIKQQKDQNETLFQQNEAFAEELSICNQQLKTLQAQLPSITASQNTPPSVSYADIAKTPPRSQQVTRSTPPTRKSGLEYNEAPYCTIDVSRVEEKEKNAVTLAAIRQVLEKELGHKCRAVVKDPRGPERVRVMCQDEKEVDQVKDAIQRGIQTQGTRVLRDQLFPVKVDNANRTQVLNSDGTIREDALTALGQENEVRIAKIVWLSDKSNQKAYGSMAIYLTRASDANHLLQKQFFDLAGESAFTRVYEPRVGPVQCYNCQSLGHKAFGCKKAQICANCAHEGHHHKECTSEIPKCTPCGGPHASYSKNCRKLYPVHG